MTFKILIHEKESETYLDFQNDSSSPKQTYYLDLFFINLQENIEFQFSVYCNCILIQQNVTLPLVKDPVRRTVPVKRLIIDLLL